jgi:DNA-binding NarL/FixJ family response regulator
MRIILAEDQPLILKSLNLLLSEEEDIEVVGIASGGEEALNLCRKLKPHVAVFDIRMPGMSGTGGG